MAKVTKKTKKKQIKANGTSKWYCWWKKDKEEDKGKWKNDSITSETAQKTVLSLFAPDLYLLKQSNNNIKKETRKKVSPSAHT